MGMDGRRLMLYILDIIVITGEKKGGGGGGGGGSGEGSQVVTI